MCMDSGGLEDLVSLVSPVPALTPFLPPLQHGSLSPEGEGFDGDYAVRI